MLVSRRHITLGLIEFDEEPSAHDVESVEPLTVSIRGCGLDEDCRASRYKFHIELASRQDELLLVSQFPVQTSNQPHHLRIVELYLYCL